MKRSIAGILKDEGYIEDFDLVDDDRQGVINIKMKYSADNEKVISGIRKISKPGLRVYAKAEDVPRVLGGLGIAIISTSKGVISDKEARRLGVGGEVICYVW
jgi:small subunit ribosomal protein S8